jgi:hypothetical protein
VLAISFLTAILAFGGSNPTNIATIHASSTTLHTIVFKDFDGRITRTYQIENGGSLTRTHIYVASYTVLSPTVNNISIVRAGYRHTGWRNNTDNNNIILLDNLSENFTQTITANITFIATYEAKANVNGRIYLDAGNVQSISHSFVYNTFTSEAEYKTIINAELQNDPTLRVYTVANVYNNTAHTVAVTTIYPHTYNFAVYAHLVAKEPQKVELSIQKTETNTTQFNNLFVAIANNSHYDFTINGGTNLYNTNTFTKNTSTEIVFTFDTIEFANLSGNWQEINLTLKNGSTTKYLDTARVKLFGIEPETPNTNPNNNNDNATQMPTKPDTAQNDKSELPNWLIPVAIIGGLFALSLVISLINYLKLFLKKEVKQ